MRTENRKSWTTVVGCATTDAKIRHCEIPMTSFNFRAKQSRCKHLCCREGLSSPPKVTRKKSDDAHSEAAESSQSRLTGNITKKGTKPIVTDIAEQPCKKSLGLPSSTQALIQQLQRSKATGEKNPSPATVDFTSSDYGDEDFDDLPSPSQLLLGVDIGPKNRNSQDQNSQNGLNDASAVQDAFEPGDSWVDGNISSLQSPLVQARTTENYHAKAFLIDLVSPEPEKMFSVLPRLDGCDGQKRKLTDRGAAYHNNGNNKRAKNWGGKTTLMDRLSAGKDENIAPEASTGESGNSRMVDVPAEREGIDPALLNDFKRHC
jgi:ATP-dependent DNA helicase HFM1/MER3